MKCRECGAELNENERFCHSCGKPVEQVSFCSKCGTKIEDGQNFCPKCGADIRNFNSKQDTSSFKNVKAFTEPILNNVSKDSLMIEDIIKNNPYKLITIFLMLMQLFLINAQLLSTSTSILGVTSNQTFRLVDVIPYPTGVFYFVIVVNIGIVLYSMFKDSNSSLLRYIPIILNLIYPLVVIYEFLNLDTSGLNILSAIGINNKISFSPTFPGILMIASIVIAEILLILKPNQNIVAQAANNQEVSRSNNVNVLFIVLLVLALAGAALMFFNRQSSNQTNNSTIVNNNTVEIPNVTGMAFEDANEVLLNHGLSVTRANVENSSTTPNIVENTDPKSGTKVNYGTNVTVYVSSSFDSYTGDGTNNVIFTARIKNNVLIRNTPSTKGNKVGDALKDQTYKVYEVLRDDFYEWYRIDNNMWIANDGNWIEKLPSDYEENLIVFPTTNIGSHVSYGQYYINSSYANEDIEWIILDNDGSKVLLISAYCLDSNIYNDYFTSWKNSNIRNWLNDYFYEFAFNSQEKSQIVTTKNTGGTPNEEVSEDKVFLLSSEEIEKYWPSWEDRISYGTYYAFSRGAESHDGKCRWWLRTLNPDDNTALNIRTSDGRINYDTSANSYGYGIRPAIWVKIGK